MNITRDTCNAIVSQSMLSAEALRHIPICYMRGKGSLFIAVAPSAGFYDGLRIFHITDAQAVDISMWHPVRPSLCWRDLE